MSVPKIPGRYRKNRGRPDISQKSWNISTKAARKMQEFVVSASP
jgi:hypothetical protein